MKKNVGSTALAVVILTLAASFVAFVVIRSADEVEFVPRDENTTTTVITTTTEFVPPTAPSTTVFDPPGTKIAPNGADGCVERLPSGEIVARGCGDS